MKNYKKIILDDANGLTNAIIQSVGRAYLNKHSNKNTNAIVKFFSSVAHKNQPMAICLTEYNVESTPYEKWLFLANCYKNLEIQQGELSRSIIRLFSSAFKDSPFDYLSIHKTDVAGKGVRDYLFYSNAAVSSALKSMVDCHYMDEFKQVAERTNLSHQLAVAESEIIITAQDLHHIANAYLARHPSKSITHRNQAAARSLLNINVFASTYQKWMALADAYGLVKGSYGELSHGILDLFVKKFHESVYTHYLRFYASRTGGVWVPVFLETSKLVPALKGMVDGYYSRLYKDAIDLSLGQEHLVVHMAK